MKTGKRMGRPPIGPEALVEQVQVYMTAKDKAALVAFTKKSGLRSPSAVLRRLMVGILHPTKEGS